MSLNSVVKFSIAVGMLLAPIAQAHAYKITYDSQTRKWSGVCADGHQWTIGNGSSQPSESQAEKICAKHGGMATGNQDGKPDGAKSKVKNNKETKKQ